MPRSKSLAAAEKRALDGKNESQDSQTLLNHYVTVYGIGVLPRQYIHPESPSPAPPVAAPADPDRGPVSKTSFAFPPPTEFPAANASSELLLATNANGDAIDSAADPAPTTCPAADEILKKVNVLPRASGHARSTKAKMDVSQQSPTQDNDERDYENYYEGPSFVETSPISQNPPDNHTLREDDSGAVNFGNLSHLIQNDTQAEDEPSSIPDDAGPAHTRGDWRNRTSSSQRQSSVQHTGVQSPMPQPGHAPRTPGHSHNPFAGNKKLGDPALAGSQLFGQTQFSSAVKRFSPTSSRPSPHVYAHDSISPNNAESSPLKNRFNVTSPPDLLSSSPQALRIETEVRNNGERSRSNSAQPEDGTVPESPQFPLPSTRPAPAPIETYEKMEDSQRRRLVNAEAEGNASESESDGVAEVMRRRKLAALKQEVATKQLTGISFRRPGSREPVGVPSTTKQPRRPRTGTTRYPVRQVDDELTASEEDIDEFTVADSQDQTTATRPVTRASPDLADSAAHAKPGVISSNDAVPDSVGATQKSGPNSAVPATESSGDSSRPKDLIPETSPNNTQYCIQGRARASSDVPLAASTPPPPDGSTAAATRPQEFEADAEPTLNSPQPALPQPSRRSARKPRPTPKAQARAQASGKEVPPAVASAPVDTDKIEAAPRETSPDLSTVREKKAVEENAPVVDEPLNRMINVEEKAPLPSSPPVSKPRAERARPMDSVPTTSLAEQNPTTPGTRNENTAPEPPGSTSTLSVLTTTPVTSSKTSPATQESVELPPLSPEKSKRGRQPTRSLPRVATGPGVSKPGTRRQARRALRLDSGSTDELTRSPSANGFENSIIQPKSTARGSRLSMLSHTSKDFGKSSIFSGMAFAVSFQSKKDGEKADHYEQRLGQSRDIEKMIAQSGGHLLKNGFDELFESNALKSTATSPMSDRTDENPLILTSFALSMGFTALIADGHSRKVKYMQALALGLPCISDRWVTTCVAKGAVVDWLPYLLCAGQSTFLRDAIRSRCIVPYSATEARLVEVVERRQKMLEGSNILLVMKKSRAEEKKMPYVFLAHVLGATLSRAHSLDEAREMMRNREQLGGPFDWVYVDEHTGTEDGLFSAAAPEKKASKKRKRATALAVNDSMHPPKKIRTLSDELVIQSLILGRMIEEGELEA
ncbi:DNA repair protein crb2 [Colletotrichum chlorophyti]|uniref:DNA repair protein crb2 n=1 Tax=Colletotrichum chlorophyti TaxID=708187 RepID=A0A1Q8RRA4_9PEZI|nr:DNA repair protein crb2 [Colletotrichum chlorophyti]